VFLAVARADEIFVRVLLECHEGLGIARAHDTAFAEDRTLLTLLVVPDFVAPCARLLDDVYATADVEFHPAEQRWIREIERELGV
jgi:hypothetical protein